MILCLDAGNTRLKYGFGDDRGWRLQGALDYRDFDSLAAQLPQPPRRIVACNVAGEAIRMRIAVLAGSLDVPLTWLTSSAAACGVSNGYDTPEQLGADRWAALIGARALHAGPAVVVMAGTATTIDALDDRGRFRGGLILPGLALMRSALAHNTADLPHAAGHYRPQPTNTDDAIVSGAIHATLGAIERIHATVDKAALCLLSGGAAAELAPHLDLPQRLVDNLVLEGLARFSRAG
ncbi:MAG: type III pantothenate kinase [Sulfuritalea sp.]|nr:type III pantothenate kinase [Sulfuritalea sp.]MDP1984745.1 type III pantothenate kinase [Sulfuritalea sp.]